MLEVFTIAPLKALIELPTGRAPPTRQSLTLAEASYQAPATRRRPAAHDYTGRRHEKRALHKGGARIADIVRDTGCRVINHER